MNRLRVGRGKLQHGVETNYRGIYIVDAKPRATITANNHLGNSSLRLLDLTVDPNYQRNKLGSHVLQALLRSTEDAGLQFDHFEGNTSSAPMIYLLHKLGGEIDYITDTDIELTAMGAVNYLLQTRHLNERIAEHKGLPVPISSGHSIHFSGTLTSFNMTDWPRVQLEELQNFDASFSTAA